MRSEKKKKTRFINIILLAFMALIFYTIGFGHGQSSAYSKMTDDYSIMDTYMNKGENK